MKERQIDNEIKKLQRRKKDLRGRKLWYCGECGKGTQIQRLTLQEIEWYHPPVGCTGGGYWASNDNPEYNIQCPKCGVVDRLYTQVSRWTKFESLNEDEIMKHVRWEHVHNHQQDFKEHKYVQRK